jgi:hypothetical protein
MAKGKSKDKPLTRPSHEASTAAGNPDNITLYRDPEAKPEDMTISRKQWIEEGETLRDEGWYSPDDEDFDDQ